MKVRLVLEEKDVPFLDSTVEPGKFAVALRKPQRRLNNVVLPTFGFPRINTELVVFDLDTVGSIGI
jgi:hypothetical protein|tara:strand:- start:401 stop:598 length:198 start_codon:yes stop_codon:yes gene_type:complete